MREACTNAVWKLLALPWLPQQLDAEPYRVCAGGRV